MVLFAATAAAGTGQKEADVVVYFHHGSESAAIIRPAENQAAAMLAGAGIDVAWRAGAAHPEGDAEIIEVRLTEGKAASYHPGALAWATLGVQTGTRVEILYDRVRDSGSPADVPGILAHVLVHEITHVLEGVERHSADGVMKARWTVADFRAMRRPLPFAEEDVQLLHAWAERHNRTVLAGIRLKAAYSKTDRLP